MAEKKKKYKNWTLEKDTDDILWCRLDVAGKSTNVLSREVLQEFQEIIDEVETDLPGGLVIASSKKSGFIAGANIDEFAEILDLGAHYRDHLFLAIDHID